MSKFTYGIIMISGLVLFTAVMLGQAEASPKYQAYKTIYVGGDADGSTACAVTLSDFDAVTDSVITCANTGELDVTGYAQITVDLHFTRGTSGTVVNMQCDKITDDLTTGTAGLWAPLTSEDSDGVLTVRTWTITTSVTGRMTVDFGVIADRLRCRYWWTGGAADDTIKAIVRKASIVPR